MYANDDVPYVLRTGANRAFHEGVGTLIELVSSQASYLKAIDLLDESEDIDQIRWLLNQALSGPITLPALRLRHHDPLRARPVRGAPALEPVQRPLVGIRATLPGRGTPRRCAARSGATPPPRPTSTTTRPSTTTTP